MTKWSPNSWRAKPIQQVPDYPDAGRARGDRRPARDLSAAGFCRRGAQAEEQLAAVAAGDGFLLQGGDCAESFAEHGADNIRDFFRVFLQMAVVLTFAGAKPVVKVGRIAGQFAKPRSSDNETVERRDAAELPRRHHQRHRVRREARLPDPARQEMAYRQSAATLNLLRAFAQGGYANLENVHHWMLGFVADSPQGEALRGARRPHLRDDGFHARDRHHLGDQLRAARDRFLHQPRGAAARLRGGADPRQFDLRRLVRDLGPHDLDRRPHPPAGPRACRILPRHQEPARPEVRAVAVGRRPAAADRHAQSRTTSPAG